MRIFIMPLLAVVLLAGCAGGVTSIPSRRSTVVLDFTPYTAQGFLFTPEPYLGDYESVGLITVTVTAAGERKRLRPGIYDWEWDLTPLQSDSVLHYFHRRATELGADAMVRFSLAPSSTDIAGEPVPTLVASGFAIRRTKK